MRIPIGSRFPEWRFNESPDFPALFLTGAPTATGGTYDSQTDVEAGVTAVRQTCFESTTGFLQRDRILKGTAAGANDVLRVYTRDLKGNRTRQQHYGGDTQSLGTGALCTFALPASAGVRQLENGPIRYYGEVKQAKTQGEMTGRRLVREWDPATGQMRTWHETLDAEGNVRIVRPVTEGEKVLYLFDEKGNLLDNF